MRVLLVEDEEPLLALAESIIENEGHRTLTAASVDQALAILRSDQAVDLLFTDLGLGETREDGIHLAQEAVRLRPELRVIYTSARTVNDGMRELFVEGSQFVQKPYRAEHVLKAIFCNA